jgi:hypothetical protein
VRVKRQKKRPWTSSWRIRTAITAARARKSGRQPDCSLAKRTPAGKASGRMAVARLRKSRPNSSNRIRPRRFMTTSRVRFWAENDW